MKCGFKLCKHDHDELIQVVNKKYHPECYKDIEDMKKVAELYKKYYNKKESWAVMQKSLNNWYKLHDAEYMLFCMSKAIRQKHPLANFFSFYHVLNNGNYRNMYNNYKNPNKNIVFENVFFSESEHTELLKYMNNNQKKLEYYIKKLNDYIIKTGKSYSSHFETLKQWYDKEESRKPVKPKNRII